jgi:pyrimidine deaminase RibD-like protein
MKGLGSHDFGKGPPSTIVSFGSEEEEHKYIKNLEKLGLPTTDIDPKDLKQPKGMKKQPVDPTYNVNEDDSDAEIHNYEKLDKILSGLCQMVTDGQESEKDYGMVAAAVLDPDNRMVARLNRPGKNGQRIHAEHAAIIGYTKQHGDIPEGSIIITTLSPCNEAMDERDGPSCTDLINRTVVKKVYCGYMDPTQTDDSRQFNLMETGNREIRIQCKEFADTFLDHVHEDLDEDVGGNYLYHATSADGLKGILQSGNIQAATGPQISTRAQTKSPTVSVSRDWGYASGSHAKSQRGSIGRDVVLVLDRNTIESKFKTLGTSQSELIKGLAYNPFLTKGGETRPQSTDPMARDNAKKKAKFAEPTSKAGGEFEEAVVVPKGTLPIKNSLVGFWVNPDSKLMNDPDIMNDPRRLDLAPGGTGRFVKASKQKDMSENFADGKNPQDKGDSKRYGVPTKASISTLRKFAKKHSGRAAQLAHWAANMKSGKRK